MSSIRYAHYRHRLSKTFAEKMNYSLRPAKPNDIEWLDPFYEKIMRPYVELTHDWNPTVFREKFRASNSQIIQAEGKDIGLFKKEIIEGNIFLWDIQLAAEYRNLGIGSKLIAHLKSEAKKMNVSIRLRVLKGNPAIYFYERHGFGIIQELDNCNEMEWKCEPGGSGNGS